MNLNLVLVLGLMAFFVSPASAAKRCQQKVAEPIPVFVVPIGSQSVTPSIAAPTQKAEPKLRSHGEQSESKPSAKSDKSKSEAPISFKFERGLDGGVIAIELSNDGSVLASAGMNKDVTLRSTEDFSVIANSKAPKGIILDLIYSRDGKHLISCGDGKQVIVFNAKDLSVTFDYKLRWRPERVAEAADGKFVAGGRSGQRAVLSFEEFSTKYDSAHKSFIGGLCSSDSPAIVYSTGDQSDGPYFLARKVKSLQKIVSLPGRPSRAVMGRNNEEVLVATANQALRVDVVRKKVVDLWQLPDAKKVEDIIYWKQRNVYVTSDKAGFVKIWQPGQADPIASHQVSKLDVYQVDALDENRLIVCGREASPNSISIWNLSFDAEKFPVIKDEDLVASEKLAASVDPSLKIAQQETIVPYTSGSNIKMSKIGAAESQEPSEKSEDSIEKPTESAEQSKIAGAKIAETKNAETKIVEKRRMKRKPSQWTALNESFEVKRINPADLNLREDLPNTKAELEWQISLLEEAKKPIPESLKNLELLQIHSAIVSPGGTLFLSTTDGLVRYDSGKESSSFVQDKNSDIIQAASLARDPVDGILIGLEGQNKVLEIRESGKLVSRGQLDPELEVEDKTKLSVTHLVAAGSDYLAISNHRVYRRGMDGFWEKEYLHTENKQISKFALLDSREIATAESNSTDVRVHPSSGIARKIQPSRKEGHASNSGNVLINSIGDMKLRKMVPLTDGQLHCVFARVRVPSSTPVESNPFNDNNAVTAGCCSLSGGSFDNLVTSNDLDWGVDGLPEKDRTILDFYPASTENPRDVWFLTPEGVGLFVGEKTQFWKSQFKLERKGIELSRIEGLGDGSYMVYTTDGVHSEDVFYIRPRK